jgi:hypothetical protein
LTDQTTTGNGSGNVTPPAAIVPGSPEYNAAMIAKAQGSSAVINGVPANLSITVPDTSGTPAAATTSQPAPVPTIPVANKPQKPEGLPDKFWDAVAGVVRVVDLTKSYTELERARTKPVEPAADGKPVEMAAAKPDPAAEAAAKAVADAAAAEAAKAAPAVTEATRATARDAANAQFQKDGKLSEESFAALEKQGYGRAEVTAYIAGQAAQAQMFANSVYAAAGGQEAYGKMIAWGQTNFAPGEVAAFDSALKSGNTDMMKMAVNGLKARYTAEFGKGGTLVTGAGTPTGGAAGPSGFASKNEMVTAMRDLRYTKGDPAFHAEVAQKVQAAIRSGVDLGLNVIINAK